MLLPIKRLIYFFYAQYYRRPNSSTVKYAFPLIFTTLTLIGAALILPTNSSYVRLESSVKKVVQGEEFKIDVYVGAHVPVNAIDLSLTYPQAQIEIKAIDTGQSVITLWTEDPYVEGNKVIMRGGTFRKGFLGEHLIATVEAVALKSGTAEFSAGSIDLLAGDGTGSEVTVAANDSQSLVIEVGNDTGEIIAEASVFLNTDIDGDGDVGMKDILAFMSAWSSREVLYDFNRDNRMNFRDFGILLSDSFYK